MSFENHLQTLTGLDSVGPLLDAALQQTQEASIPMLTIRSGSRSKKTYLIQMQIDSPTSWLPR
jgi:hypothetical protein